MKIEEKSKVREIPCGCICSITTLIIVTFFSFIIIDCGGRRYHRINNEAGYYCEYCHQGCSLSEESCGYANKRDNNCKNNAYNLLKYKPCPKSKDGMHKIKWYNKNPNKKRTYIE